MSKPIYMVVGCPGSGKSWVCEQLKDKYNYIRHDDFIGKGKDAYLSAILEASKSSEKPILIETPFSISQLKDPLERAGLKINTNFIVENDSVIKERYMQREKAEIPPGHLTRQKTYKQRAVEYDGFAGKSDEVLKKLSEPNE